MVNSLLLLHVRCLTKFSQPIGVNLLDNAILVALTPFSGHGLSGFRLLHGENG